MEEIKVQNQMDEMFEEPSGEDMLLAQIDAFRDKAKQLQTLISAKERKVKELEAMAAHMESVSGFLCPTTQTVFSCMLHILSFRFKKGS